MRECRWCQYYSQADAAFCTKCGHSFTETARYHAAPADIPHVATVSTVGSNVLTLIRKRPMLGCVGLWILLIIASSINHAINPPPPDPVWDAQVARMRQEANRQALLEKYLRQDLRAAEDQYMATHQ